MDSNAKFNQALNFLNDFNDADISKFTEKFSNSANLKETRDIILNNVPDLDHKFMSLKNSEYLQRKFALENALKSTLNLGEGSEHSDVENQLMNQEHIIKNIRDTNESLRKEIEAKEEKIKKFEQYNKTLIEINSLEDYKEKISALDRIPVNDENLTDNVLSDSETKAVKSSFAKLKEKIEQYRNYLSLCNDVQIEKDTVNKTITFNIFNRLTLKNGLKCCKIKIIFYGENVKIIESEPAINTEKYEAFFNNLKDKNLVLLISKVIKDEFKSYLV